MAFQPVRSSSPSKALHGDTIASISADIARSSTAPIAEFKGLTPQDVQIIDAVIQRADPSATTFLAIFKAYNDILLEHGLDPHEVTYYGKLLKLGTLRGQSWGEKWAMVKRHHGYADRGQTSSAGLTEVTSPTRPVVSTLASVEPRRGHDVPTTCSQNDEPEFRGSDTDTGVDAMQQYSPRMVPQSSSSIPHNSLGLNIGNPRHYGRVVEPRLYSKPQPSRLRSDAWASTSSEGGRTAPTLPSYGAAIRETPLAPPLALTKQDRLSASPAFTASAARRAVAKARECRGSVVNEDEAWKNIRMAQDEKEADRFRDEKLIERCWDIWRQGLQWVHVSIVVGRLLPVTQSY
jgi:protein SFI1